MRNKYIVVLGAGASGLSAAWKLSQESYKVTVIEKAPRVGGLSATFQWKDYLLDYGPHAFHVKSDGIVNFLSSLCKCELPIKKRNIYMLIRGRYFHYPLKLYEVLRGLNPALSLKIVLGYALTQLKQKFLPIPEISFEAWGIKNFGNTLYNLLFGQYSERLWGLHPSKLSVELAYQKLHKLNLKDVILKLFGGKGEEQVTYWEDFIYPEQGIGLIYENFAREIKENQGEILLNAECVRLNKERDEIKAVECIKDGKRLKVECDKVISSIPIRTLVNIIHPQLDKEILNSADSLSQRAIIMVYLVFPKEHITNAHWIYLLDPEFYFNRFSEQKNLGKETSPPDKTVIAFEKCCDKGDKLWNSPNEYLYELALKDVDKLDIMDRNDVMDYYIARVEDAYPIFGIGFENNLSRVIEEIAKIKNLLSIGRQGLFLNNDIHDNIKEAFEAVEYIKNGKSIETGMIRISRSYGKKNIHLNLRI